MRGSVLRGRIERQTHARAKRDEMTASRCTGVGRDNRNAYHEGVEEGMGVEHGRGGVTVSFSKGK